MDGTALRSQIASNLALLRDGVKVQNERMDINISRDAAGQYTAWVFVKLPGQIPQAMIKGAASSDAESALDVLLDTVAEIVDQKCQAQFQAFMARPRTEFNEGSFVLTGMLRELPPHQNQGNQGA